MTRSVLLFAAGTAVLLSACGGDPDPTQYGADPTLPKAERGLLPNMKIATPAACSSRSTAAASPSAA